MWLRWYKVLHPRKQNDTKAVWVHNSHLIITWYFYLKSTEFCRVNNTPMVSRLSEGLALGTNFLSNCFFISLMVDNNLKIIQENFHFHFFCTYKILKIQTVNSWCWWQGWWQNFSCLELHTTNESVINSESWNSNCAENMSHILLVIMILQIFTS